MTTTPARSSQVWPALAALLGQSRAPDAVYLVLPTHWHVPQVSEAARAFDRLCGAPSDPRLHYTLPPELGAHCAAGAGPPLLVVWLAEDHGPLCKLLGGLLVERAFRRAVARARSAALPDGAPTTHHGKRRRGPAGDLRLYEAAQAADLLAGPAEAAERWAEATAHWPAGLPGAVPQIHAGVVRARDAGAPSGGEEENEEDEDEGRAPLLAVADDDSAPPRGALAQLEAELLGGAEVARGNRRPAVGFGGTALGRLPPYYRVERTTVPRARWPGSIIEFGPEPRRSVDWLLGTAVVLFPTEHFDAPCVADLVRWADDPMARRADDALVGAVLAVRGVPRIMVRANAKTGTARETDLPGALSASLWRAARCHEYAWTAILAEADTSSRANRSLVHRLLPGRRACWVAQAAALALVLVLLAAALLRALAARQGAG